MSELPQNNSVDPSTTLWLADGGQLSDKQLAFFRTWLSASEERRFASFVRPMRRRQFIIGRTLLRFAVSDLTGLSPDLIYIEESRGNQPRLLFPQDHCITLNFSLSHSGKWAACAISLEAVLGVDIEVNDPNRDFDAIVEIAFGSHEKDWLLAQSRDRRTEAFYSLWCAQEALFKLLCNLDHQNELSALPAKANVLRHKNSSHYQYHLRVADLTVAILSDRQLSAIQQRGLTGADRGKWTIPADDAFLK